MKTDYHFRTLCGTAVARLVRQELHSSAADSSTHREFVWKLVEQIITSSLRCSRTDRVDDTFLTYRTYY
jgi:hypothetical protein